MFVDLPWSSLLTFPKHPTFQSRSVTPAPPGAQLRSTLTTLVRFVTGVEGLQDMSVLVTSDMVRAHKNFATPSWKPFKLGFHTPSPSSSELFSDGSVPSPPPYARVPATTLFHGASDLLSPLSSRLGAIHGLATQVVRIYYSLVFVNCKPRCFYRHLGPLI